MHSTIIQADCIEAMKAMEANSVDAVVTDPPYGLSFMGKKWDYDVPSVEVWRECLRLLKPGGHMLVACGTRTQHRMVVNIEDAGFEVRDVITWLYGSGFPKSLDVSKAIDKAAGAVGPIIGKNPAYRSKEYTWSGGEGHTPMRPEYKRGPATDHAKQWAGWGTALKPACEFWTLVRKPLEGTVASNVLKWGVGGLNIDGCRITSGERRMCGTTDSSGQSSIVLGARTETRTEQGRFPANLILDEEAGALLDEQSGFSKTVPHRTKPAGTLANDGSTMGKFEVRTENFTPHNDSGGASRFFYCAKVSASERNAGLEGMPTKEASVGNREAAGRDPSNPANYHQDSVKRRVEAGLPATAPKANHHPTVKPLKLMRYLCRLITPPGGIVLDPFAGSGSTLVAAKQEGFRFIGIEREAEYAEIARKRIDAHTPDLL